MNTGEWKIDKNGRKYRRIGSGQIEYAPTVITSAGEVYVDELPKFHERMKAHTAEILKERQAAARDAHTGRSCPFKIARAGMHTLCQKDCVFYRSDACGFSDMKEPATVNTKGVFCPIIGSPCREDCGMYNAGCTLI